MKPLPLLSILAFAQSSCTVTHKLEVINASPTPVEVESSVMLLKVNPIKRYTLDFQEVVAVEVAGTRSRGIQLPLFAFNHRTSTTSNIRINGRTITFPENYELYLDRWNNRSWQRQCFTQRGAGLTVESQETATLVFQNKSYAIPLGEQ